MSMLLLCNITKIVRYLVVTIIAMMYVLKCLVGGGPGYGKP